MYFSGVIRSCISWEAVVKFKNLLMHNLLIRDSLVSPITLSQCVFPLLLLRGAMLFTQLLDVTFRISCSLENILLFLRVPQTFLKHFDRPLVFLIPLSPTSSFLV